MGLQQILRRILNNGEVSIFVNRRSLHIFKNLALTLTLAVILLGATVNYAQAAQGVINYDVVNVRSGPGTNYQIAGTILKDSKVTILQTQGDWRQVSFGNNTGWIAGQYIDTVGIGQLVITGDWANLRSAPGTNYMAVGKANKGEVFTLLSKEGDWYHILTASGSEAYVVGYLAQISPANQPTGTGGSTAQPITTAKPGATNAASGQSAKGVSVFLNGTALSFEVPPLVENGRTLVPLRAIFEAMGASVEWNAGTQTVISRKGSDVVVLPLNSTKPTINGQFYNLEVPAKIVKDRTLAPLRFVAEAFGGKVDWNDTTKTVTISSTSSTANTGGSPSIAGAGTGTPSVSTGKTVTAKVADVSLREQPTGAASALSVTQPGENLTILAVKDDWYQVSRGNLSAWVASWMVEPSTASAETLSAGSSAAGSSTPSGTTEEVGTIHISKTSDSKGIILTLSSTESFKPDITENSGTIQYNLGKVPVAAFNGLDESMGDGKLTITKTTVQENNMITISLPSWVKYELNSESDKKYIVTIPNCVTSLEKTAFGSVGDRIVVHLIAPISAQTGTLNGNNLEVKLPGTTVKNGYSFSGSGTLFNNVAINENGGDLLFTINTNELGRYSLVVSGKNLNIILMRKMVTNSGEKIVVLDPGHGGSDCGSSGTMLKEKDVNLAVALKVGAILQQRGIRVEYTRTDDTYMTVSEEADIGNALNATVFMSIHCNSSKNIGPSGTETYFYAPMEIPELYAQREERSRLANLIQTKMIANLQLVNRGVKDNQPYWVLKYTTMPSALVELGFINNPTEENLLAQEGTRDLAAQAIVDAIGEYLQSL